MSLPDQLITFHGRSDEERETPLPVLGLFSLILGLRYLYLKAILCVNFLNCDYCDVYYCDVITAKV